MNTLNLNNPILNTDSYKISHFKQYPPGATNVFSYIEARGGEFPESVFFGLQAFIKEYLQTPITMEDVDQAELICNLHGFEQFNRPMWERIVKVHNGLMPLVIKAVPEGTVVPVSNALVTVECTDPHPDMVALTSYWETALLRAVWAPTTIASNGRQIKKTIDLYLRLTADSADGIGFTMNDFGARGVSSYETSALLGLAHLVNFVGTDNIPALLAAAKYYNVDLTNGNQMPGFSIPAAEHSTMTSWGKDREADAYRNMLEVYGREGSLLAVVSDSYDIFNACENIWGEKLRQQVVESGATVVIRPDSGDPREVVLRCLEILGRKFGTTTNTKGYKVLNNVRMIQGDGIDGEMVKTILGLMADSGWSADNIVFGSGGGLLQKFNRDTMKFAMKCAAVQVNGEWIDVYKDPATDPGKVSKKGRMTLVQNRAGEYKTIREEQLQQYLLNGWAEVLRTVYLNGELVVDDDLEAVRSRAAV